MPMHKASVIAMQGLAVRAPAMCTSHASFNESTWHYAAPALRWSAFQIAAAVTI
jgi:hypothetical protein